LFLLPVGRSPRQRDEGAGPAISRELAPSSDPSGHLLPGGEKKPAATLYPASVPATIRPLIHEARDAIAGFLVRGTIVISVLLTLFVKIMESTMKWVGA